MRLIIILLLTLFFCSALVGQKVPCSFDGLHLEQTHQDVDYRINEVRLNNQWALLANHEIESSRIPFTIPVVVHVVTPPGTPIGQGNNITDAQVELGIELMNEIFSNSGRYVAPNGVDTEISFCLARRDPNGQPTTGVVRVESELVNEPMCGVGTDQASEQAIKALSNWDCTEYMNVWLVTDLFSGANGCGLAGFAYFPGARCGLDGIVQESRYWLTTGGATVSAHEVGHYLGLYHTFQGGCQNNDCTTDGDRICDTPPDGSQAFAPCGTNSCNTDNPDLPDDTENIMDYSNCGPIHFTQDQSARMQMVLANQRQPLTESSACLPVVDLDAAVLDIIFPKGNCSDSLCVEVEFRNIGRQNLTSANVRMRTNAGPWITQPWNGNLALGDLTSVSFPCQFIAPGSYIVEVELIDPNGSNDEYIINNSRSETQDVVSILRTQITDVQPARCQSNGEVNLSSSGGQPPYQYTLEMGRPPQASGYFNFLTKGNYTVTVTDQIGCSSTIAVTIPDSCAKDEPRNFVLNGRTVYNGNTCYTLVRDVRNQSGSMWYEDLTTLDEDFNVSFQMNLGCRDGSGADGIAFVFQPLSTNIGASGGGLGYQGVSPSVAVEFDTWQNGDVFDPAYDHLAIQGNGNIAHRGPLNLAGPVGIIASRGNVEDCDWRNVVVEWDVSEELLSVFVECDLRLTYQGDIVEQFFGGNPNVYFGFTAATGGSTNLHQVCINYVSATDKLQDEIICQGDRVEKKAPSVFADYSWTPTTGIDNPRVFNPIFSPDTTTTYYVNMKGQCFDIQDSFTIEVIDLSIDSLAIEFDSCGELNNRIHVWVEPDSTGVEYSLDGINYQRDPVLFGQEGLNTVFVKKGFCRKNEIIEIELPLQLSDSLIFQSPESCRGLGSFIVEGKGGIPPYEYRLDAGNWGVQGQFNNLSTGLYSYTIRDQLGCEISGEVFISDFTTSISIILDSSDLRIDCCDSLTWIQVSSMGSILATYSLDDLRENTTGYFDNILPGVHFITVEEESECPSDTLWFEVQEFSDGYRLFEVDLCSGKDTVINQRTYNSQGVYFDTLAKSFCCDSILEIRIQSFPAPVINQSFNLCEGDSVQVGTSWYDATGRYLDTFTIAGSCDSIIETILDVGQIYAQERLFDFCPSDTYDLGYRSVDRGGTFVDTFQTFKGCDSIVVNNVNIYELDTTRLVEQGCPGFEVRVGNQTFNSSGTFEAVLSDQNGCDSLVRLSLTIDREYDRLETVALCPTDTIDIFGQAIMDTGMYRFDYTSISGCDSIINVRVITNLSNACDSLIKIWTPNVFSPNGDFINDRFNIFGNNQLVEVELMEIYTRWGELVWVGENFLPNTSEYGWDGSFNNQLMLPGVYVYRAEVRLLTGENRVVSGDVTLVE